MLKILIVAILMSNVTTGRCKSHSRIIGGRGASEEKFPYLVSIKTNEHHICGGSIINKYWILTAAHCIEGEDLKTMKIMAGSELLNGGTKKQIFDVKYAVMHQNFKTQHMANDIGLIKVDREINFSNRVQPVKLPKVDIDKNGTLATLAGWGTHDQVSGDSPNKLQEIELKIYDYKKCEKEWQDQRFKVGFNHICTLTKVGEGACLGDSGGPLVVSGNIQIGIVSFIRKCAKGKPDVFTRVYSYMNWIESQMKNYEKSLIKYIN